MDNKNILRNKPELPERGFTHGSSFHADDVFSTALLQILKPGIQIQRGLQVPQDFDGIVYDIGRGRFDHHQEDKEIRKNGTPYAAFGLLWREYGEYILDKESARRFDEQFIQPLDESDNTGCENMLAKIVSQFNPGWDSQESCDDRFWEAVAFARRILENYFENIQGISRARVIVEKAMKESDGTILVLPCYAPWKAFAIGSSYQVAVYPSQRGGYGVQGVPASRESTELVCAMPEEWRGKTPEELKALSGIPTIRFCHATGFLAAADTREDAMAIARYAVQAAKKQP